MTKSISPDDTIDLMTELLLPMAKIARTIKLDAESEHFENDAEHSFLLATLGCAIARELDPTLDLGKISQYALVHDLVEVHAGDTSVWAPEEEHATKKEREHEALRLIEKRFGRRFPWVDETIKEYEKFDDPESCFVYALDKIIPSIVMLSADHQAFLPTRELHNKKMSIARAKVEQYPALLALFDAIRLEHDNRSHFFSQDN